ncbi:(2Fe-2S) ferredoxin domain-containing protein [Sphingomonas sp. GlSt437]|uniref:(2Fe-2S) ferredoxin domain-containing protein n=1 Tax=Sphingomonas sp. GlSt437 TaxID=3389970 RepID=UPI003A8ABC91
MKAVIASRWERTILVCAKCSKKVDGGFGNKGKQRLAKALRRYLGIKRWRKSPIGIVEVKCLGVCSKGGVTVVDAAKPGTWHVVPQCAEVETVAAMLDLVPDSSSLRA